VTNANNVTNAKRWQAKQEAWQRSCTCSNIVQHSANVHSKSLKVIYVDASVKAENCQLVPPHGHFISLCKTPNTQLSEN